MRMKERVVLRPKTYTRTCVNNVFGDKLDDHFSLPINSRTKEG